jgi:HEAT repeat
MDFSSVTRALESLGRRNPPLHETVVLRSQEVVKAEHDADVILSTVEFFITTTHVEMLDNGEGKEEDIVTAAGIVTQTGIRWEPLAVGLFVATELLNQQNTIVRESTGTSDTINDASPDNEGTVYVDGPRVPSVVPTEAVAPTKLPSLSVDQIAHLCDILHAATMTHLEHREPRVRTLVAKAIGVYARVSIHIWPASTTYIQELNARLTRSMHEHIAAGRDEQGQYSRATGGALDDTTGWRALETNWLALASLISALQGRYISELGITPEILQDCEFSSITHVNRHVRAASMACLEQMIRACAVKAKTEPNDPIIEELLTKPLSSSSSAILRKTAASVASTGLADNWSQVRMAASVLCRVLLMTLQELGHPVDDLYPSLLPRMCLNRFYLAQGVKIYSHETWKLVFTNSALPKIADNLPAVCRYYIKMCDADNHAVREAACQAIAEVAVRLGENEEYTNKLKNHIDSLLQALVMCFHDESWPVRDEACLACGIICKAFPEECRPELKLLWERWTEQLTDQIWSVREDAAVALGDALEAYGPEIMEKIRDLIRKILPAAKDQPAMTRQQYKTHVNDIEAHTDSTLYSCGSLAPKLRKGGAGRIGCSSCGIDRPKAPWEATDGCIYLLRELCQKCSPPTDGSAPLRMDILLSDDDLKVWLKELADVCRVQHFPQSDDLRTTLWRSLPTMAYAIGKDRFKRHFLDIFMDLLFSNMESRSASQLSVHAAGQCAEELSLLVGPAIFRGRLEDYQRDLFDRTMRERQMMPKGPAGGDSFSPFGPTDLLDGVMGKQVFNAF